MTDEKLAKALELIREHNEKAVIVTTAWDDITGEQILSATEGKALLTLDDIHDEDECDDPECECHHHHHHDHDEDEEHEHHHHHHDHDEHDEHEHHHHHHHADEVFTSWGKETARKYTKEEIADILNALSDSEKYGLVLRAKGIVPAVDGTWIHYDFVPEESDVRTGSADYTGRICVIGSKLNESELEKLFKLA